MANILSLLRKHIFLVIAVFVLIWSSVLVISYATLRRFVFSGIQSEDEIKQSVRIAEIQKELLGRPGAEQVSFETVDGITLQGIFFPVEQAQGSLLLCHGYKSCKEFQYRFLAMFPSYNILMFDFRAHGQSDGWITSIGCHEYKDVSAAATFLRQKTISTTGSTKPLFILGVSMGGAATLKACALDPTLCDAMVIDSTYAHLTKMFLRGFSLRVGLPYYPFFPVIKALFHYYADCSLFSANNIMYAQNITAPVFFIHSCDDAFIKPKDTVKMYAAATNSVCAKIWIAPSCEHGYLHVRQPDRYAEKINNFFKQVIQ